MSQALKFLTGVKIRRHQIEFLKKFLVVIVDVLISYLPIKYMIEWKKHPMDRQILDLFNTLLGPGEIVMENTLM